MDLHRQPLGRASSPSSSFSLDPPIQHKSYLLEGKLFRPRHFGDSIGESTEAKSSPCLLGCGTAGKRGLETPVSQQHKVITVKLHKENKLTNMRSTRKILTVDSLSSWRHYKECSKLSLNLLNLQGSWGRLKGQHPSRYMKDQILEHSRREDQLLGILNLVSKMPHFLSLLHYLISLLCWKGKGLASQKNQGILFVGHPTQLSY